MPTIAERLNHLPLTRLHVAIAALCGAGLLIDTAELSIGGVFSIVFSTPGSPLDAQGLALLLASVFVGGAVGAPILGWLSDRCGRRTALQISLALVALPSFGGALAHDGIWLIACRFLSGMALGAYPPLMHAYFADVLPPRWRGTVDMAAVAFGLLGWPLVAMLVFWLTPWAPLDIEGWRWALHVGGMASLLVCAGFLLVPESPRNLLARGKLAAAERACRRLERSAGMSSPDTEPAQEQAAMTEKARIDFARHWRALVLIGLVYLLRPWPTIGFPLVSGIVLVAKGVSVDEGLISIGISGVGAAAGALCAAFVIDRTDRRTALMLVSAGLVGSGLIFATGQGAPVLIGSIAIFSFLTAIYGPILSIYAAETFPTAIRASATASAWALNRLGSAVAPLVLIPLLHGAGSLAMFGLIAATLVANLLLIVLFGTRGRAGLSIE